MILYHGSFGKDATDYDLVLAVLPMIRYSIRWNCFLMD